MSSTYLKFSSLHLSNCALKKPTNKNPSHKLFFVVSDYFCLFLIIPDMSTIPAHFLDPMGEIAACTPETQKAVTERQE